MMNRISLTLLGLLLTLTAFFASGCGLFSQENNYLTCEDFLRQLNKYEIPVTKAQRLDPTPLRASEGIAYEIGGLDIGIYKFNQYQELRRKRLQQIKDSGCIYVLGQKYPTAINGSFILIGYERNQEKERILEAFYDFK